MNDELIFTDCIRDKQIKFAMQHGWKINPLCPGSKEPLPGTNGVRSAIDDYATLQTLNPDTNFGIPAKANNLLILDIDRKHDAQGFQTFDQLSVKLGTLPDTLRVHTPSGGLHIYFQRPVLAEGRRVARKGWNGIDIQYDDFYTLCPYAIIDNAVKHAESIGSYRIALDRPLAKLPEKWIRELPSTPFSVRPERPERPARTAMKREVNGDCFTPWDDFNARGDVTKLLQDAGWSYSGEDGAQSYWTRPGKRDGVSATLRMIDGVPIFYVFSTEIAELEPDYGYSPSELHCKLCCGNDPSQSARTLYHKGYGFDSRNFTQQQVAFARKAAKGIAGATTASVLRFLNESGILKLAEKERTQFLNVIDKALAGNETDRIAVESELMPGAAQIAVDIAKMRWAINNSEQLKK